MKKSIIIALTCATSVVANAETPKTMAGHWVSQPVEQQTSLGHITTVYDIDFTDNANAQVKATSQMKGMQFGSNVMKADFELVIEGPMSYTLDGGNISLKFDQGKPKATVDPAKIVLDIPAPMREAMAARMDDFLGAISGSAADKLSGALVNNGISFEGLDIDPATPSVMTSRKGDAPEIVVTFNQQ